MKSYGLLLEPVQPEDFVFGSANSLNNKFSGRSVLRPDADWRPWLPTEEPQAPIYETNACVSFGTNNALEILLRFQYERVSDFSDRDVAEGSGTDPMRGNSPKAVAEYIRKNWALFEQEWPASAAKTVLEFYADVPANLRQLAKGRGVEWDFGYEYVNTSKANLKEALKYSPLGITVPAWTRDNDAKYYRPEGMNDNHWVAAVAMTDAGELIVFDTYAPYIKVLRADLVPSVAMAYHLTRQVRNEKSWVQYLIDLVLAVFQPPTMLPVTPTPPATLPPTPPPAPKFLWDTPQRARHSVRLICDEEKLTLEQKNTLCATIAGESSFNTKAINYNKKGGKVTSTDYGICQWNDFYHGKEIPPDEALNNPERAVRLMCAYWKRGQRNLWVAYSSGLYKKYL